MSQFLHQEKKTSCVFRPDVEGLRGLSLIAATSGHYFSLILARYGLPESGFVGVDFFFVISGFLITQIILGEIYSGTFSLGAFYIRRIKRLMPAMMTVMGIFLLGIGIFWGGLVWQNVCTGVLFSGTGLANFFAVFWSVGYGSIDALNMFNHLWSLGVEEQFYLIWPVVLLFLCRRKWSLKKIYYGILFLIIFSFLCHYSVCRLSPSHAFYATPARLWEIAVGCLLGVCQLQENVNSAASVAERHHANALFAGYGHKNVCFWFCFLGVILFGGWALGAAVSQGYSADWAGWGMFISFLGCALLWENRGKSADFWLSLGGGLFILGSLCCCRLGVNRLYATLFPVTGAYFLIGASSQGWLNRHVFSHKWLRVIGRVSYSVYVWHFPPLAAMNLWGGRIDWELDSLVLCLVISVFAGLATYYFVERPCRSKGNVRWILAGMLGVLCVAGFGLLAG